MNNKLNSEIVRKLIFKMTNYYYLNISKIKNNIPSFDYRDNHGSTLLHIFIDSINSYYYIDEEYERKCFLAIKTLLKYGLDPNLEDNHKNNFIQLAINDGYSENFIISIIKEALKYNLDVNHTDEDDNTIIHNIIYSDAYCGNIKEIFELLYSNGFDISKIDYIVNELQRFGISNVAYYKRNEINEFCESFYSKKKSKKLLK